MSAKQIGVLVALYSFQQILGSVAQRQPRMPLPPPRNVTLMSKNFSMALTWLPGEGSTPDVLYTVMYRIRDEIRRWEDVPDCQNISQTTCNLTCVRDLYNKFSARVKALSAGLQSSWVESNVLEYYFNVGLAPPTLQVSTVESTIHVNATFHLPSCVETVLSNLKYDLDFWEAGTENKTMFYDRMKWDQITIKPLPRSGNYCLSARASFQTIKLKHSEFSKPVCVLLNPNAMYWKIIVTLAVPSFILLFLCTVAASVFHLCKQAAKREKRPQALDFFNFRDPGKTLEKELSEKEHIEADILFCAEKPVVGVGRSIPLARNKPSLMASFLSLLEEDDSGSLRLYTEMPRCLKRAPSCQAASMSQQASHSELGSFHLDEGSVLDLAGLGFSHLVWNGGSPKEDTSGFHESEKSSLSDDSYLGDFTPIEARYPATGRCGQQDWDVDLNQSDVFLQKSVLTERLIGKPPTEEHHLLTSGPHYTNRQQHLHLGPTACVAEASEDSGSFSLDGQLVCFQTLKLMEDEGISSDSDSKSLTECTEGALPPLILVASETLAAETWGEGGSLQQESNSTSQFRGYQHARYMPRN
ncbi:interferon lambda receptor 1 [Carettochelys insculpta]|uniref:interferon lambda receptor 1 n=1 Tax=Carettochelys insculpta TaxID=44489 RepID=UPI003EBECDCB